MSKFYEIVHMPRWKLNLFLVFLTLSFISWFFIQLADTFTGNIVFKIKYSNVPEHLLLTKANNEDIIATVQASGYYFFVSSWKQKYIDIDISQISNKQSGEYVLYEAQFSPKISRQIPSDVKLLGLNLSELVFDMEEIESKKVVVIPQIEVSPASNHMIIEDLLWRPDSITVYGSKKILDTIFSVKTIIAEEENLKSSFEKSFALDLEIYQNKQLKFSHREISLNAQIGAFTEKEFSIPVEVKGIPDTLSIKTFPTLINLVCQIPVSKLDVVKEEDFVISADYNQKTKSNLHLSVSQKPKYIRKTELEPKKVTFLLKKVY